MNYTIILPFLDRTEETQALLESAVSSLQGYEDAVQILLVYPQKLATRKVKDMLPDGFHYKHVHNDGDTDFCSQVNVGLAHTTTEWFSILEVDDQYTPNWFNNVERYRAVYTDVDVFLPVVSDRDAVGKFTNFTNESLWAMGFSDVQGFLDNKILTEYQNFQISGGVYKTEKIKSLGGLKSNIKLYFGYELLLRLTHHNVRIMTIPKVGYKHTNMRENSLFWNYKHDDTQRLSPAEVKFWLDTAQKEQYFTEQREVSYSE
jgi:hypothetical protein